MRESLNWRRPPARSSSANLTTVDDILGRLRANFYLAYALGGIAGGRLLGDGPATAAGFFLAGAIAVAFGQGWAGCLSFRN